MICARLELRWATSSSPSRKIAKKTPEISGRRPMTELRQHLGCDLRCFQIATSRFIKQRCTGWCFEPLPKNMKVIWDDYFKIFQVYGKIIQSCSSHHQPMSSCHDFLSYPSFEKDTAASKVLDTEAPVAAQGQASQKGTGGAMADPVGVPRRWRIRGSAGDHGIILPFLLKPMGFGW